MRGIDDLEGDRSVSRRVTDHAGGPDARFTGTLRLERTAPDGLRYREAGELWLDGGPAFVAERVYLWQIDAAGVEVRFADGRPFHRFVPEGRAEGTEHPCGADFYRVVYDLTAWPDWRSRWRVTGPRKDYTMETLCRRC